MMLGTDDRSGRPAMAFASRPLGNPMRPTKEDKYKVPCSTWQHQEIWNARAFVRRRESTV